MSFLSLDMHVKGHSLTTLKRQGTQVGSTGNVNCIQRLYLMTVKEYVNKGWVGDQKMPKSCQHSL